MREGHVLGKKKEARIVESERGKKGRTIPASTRLGWLGDTRRLEH